MGLLLLHGECLTSYLSISFFVLNLAAQPDFTTRPPGNPSLSGLGDNKQLIGVDGRDHEEGNGSFLAMQHKDTFFTYTLAQLCIVSFN